MPKRGARLPWKLRTTWANSDIKPFTEAFYTEEGALGARIQRLRIANRKSDGAGTFVITNQDDPSYVASEPERCPFCPLWGTEWVWQVLTHLCADHAEVLEDLLLREGRPS
jgi:hypothetical protein